MLSLSSMFREFVVAGQTDTQLLLIQFTVLIQANGVCPAVWITLFGRYVFPVRKGQNVDASQRTTTVELFR